MTYGYEAFWRVGTAQVSTNPEVVKAAKEVQEQVKKARQF
jgi:3D-(3,5/4)-trihydroxycyclohexane-1,2-dione acylhydrolase (decyclizing)